MWLKGFSHMHVLTEDSSRNWVFNFILPGVFPPYMLHYVPIKCTYAANAVCFTLCTAKEAPRCANTPSWAHQNANYWVTISDVHLYFLQAILHYFCLSLTGLCGFKSLQKSPRYLVVWIVVCVWLLKNCEEVKIISIIICICVIVKNNSP